MNETSQALLISINDIQLNNRVLNALKNSHVEFQYLGQFCFLNKRQIGRIPNLGKAGADNIQDALAAHNLEMGMLAEFPIFSQEFSNVIAGGQEFLEKVAQGKDPRYNVNRAVFVQELMKGVSGVFEMAADKAEIDYTSRQSMGFYAALAALAEAASIEIRQSKPKP